MARSEQAGACCLVKRFVHGRLAGMTDFRGAKSDSDYIVHQDGPINAEPKPEQLADQWKTPASLGYMRNHGEILHLDKASYRLKIEVEDVLKTLLLRDTAYADITSLGLEEIIEKCGRVELAAALQCAGNRRDELDAREEVEGIKWSSGTVLNAKWSGELPVLSFVALYCYIANVSYVRHPLERLSAQAGYTGKLYRQWHSLEGRTCPFHIISVMRTSR